MKCIAAVAAARMDVLVGWCAGWMDVLVRWHRIWNCISSFWLQWSFLQSKAMQCKAMQFRAMQCKAMQIKAVQFKTLQGKGGAQINCMQAPTANRVVNNIELHGEWALHIQ